MNAEFRVEGRSLAAHRQGSHDLTRPSQSDKPQLYAHPSSSLAQASVGRQRRFPRIRRTLPGWRAGAPCEWCATLPVRNAGSERLWLSRYRRRRRRRGADARFLAIDPIVSDHRVPGWLHHVFLVREHLRITAATNVLAHVALGLAALWIGYRLALVAA